MDPSAVSSAPEGEATPPTAGQETSPIATILPAPSSPPKSRTIPQNRPRTPVEGSSPGSQCEAAPPPQSASVEDGTGARTSRSTSNASRNNHRLSLTLPIALPTSDPSRPPSTVQPSFPGTPVDSAATSPFEASDFIIAIAAQERKVLELREELGRAEQDLAGLKKQWSAKEAFMKRTGARGIEPLRPLGPQLDTPDGTDSSAARRSVDFDRRKILMQGQSTPKEHRRRVMRGGHTRTLSLLSPTKPESGFAVHEDTDASQETSDSSADTRPQLNPALAKRASWQPRSYHPNQQGVKQMAEDFKSGLWSFVEDIRQATVGDEPITGHANRPPANLDSTTRRERSAYAADQDTIKASTAPRSRLPLGSAFDEPVDTPTRAPAPTRERPIPKSRDKSKHFSWTPLTFDSMDDNDWSNWDSPLASSAKTTRWSGSTVSGGEAIASIPEKTDETDTSLKKKPSRPSMAIDTGVSPAEPTIYSPAKLEEIIPNVVNRFTPSNIKRTANNLMDEWERSLSPPKRETDLIDLR